MEVDIFKELDAALERTGTTRAGLARRLHIAKGTVSNWEYQSGRVPVGMLLKISGVLSDTRFKYAAASYCFHIPLMSNTHYEETAFGRYAALMKADGKRQEMDQSMIQVISKEREYRTDMDRRYIRKYTKALDEQIAELISLKLNLADEWHLEGGDADGRND